jgi:hypothetical protein
VLTLENKKLLDSYDVLKEHEVNIIKDVHDRKVRERYEDVSTIDALKSKLEEKDIFIKQLELKITDLNSEVR